MQLDFNVVGALGLVLGGFSYYVRLTIKSSISDLKDDLAILYVARNEIEARLSGITHRLSALEARILGTHAD